MNYNYLLKNNNFNTQAMLRYGFKDTGNNLLVFRKDLLNGLCVEVNFSATQFSVEVYDTIFNEKYAPFSSGHGGVAIKSQVRQILEDIISECCVVADVRTQLNEHIVKTYGVECQRPWEDSPNFCTYKAKNSQKWFAIVMDIPSKSLGLQGESLIDIVNVKLPPQTIAQLVDNCHYFPAYHMNKTYWITILLNSNTDVAQLFRLVDQSYNLVEKPAK